MNATLQGLIVGVASGACSAWLSVAVLKNDIRWIREQLHVLGKRIEKLEDRA